MQRVTRMVLGGLLSLPFFAAMCFAQAPATREAPATQAAQKTRIAAIQLSDELQERPPGFSLSDLFEGLEPSPPLSKLIVTLNQAAKDPNVGGVLLDLRAFELSLAQAQEVGNLIRAVRDAGKHVIVYAPDFDMPTYLMASYADTVVMPEQGDMLIPGVQMGLLFFKGLLDKIHVQPDLIQVGRYKGAQEPLTRTEASPEFAQQINALADGFYDQILSTLAANRHLSREKAQGAIDTAWLMGKQAKEVGLVDQLMNRHELDAWLGQQFPGGVDLVRDYGREKRKGLDLSNPFALLQLLLNPKPAASRPSQPAVAVVYAVGTIMPDVPDDSFLAGEDLVTPARMRKALDKALKEDRVKAIVLRVDSPGGSASASDTIWHLLRDTDQRKPVTVSMGRVAASGGYYIASAGRSITADPATITGSIGVVGGKLVARQLLDRIGVNVQHFQRGQRAGILSLTQPFTDAERAYLLQQMQQVYDQFTSRVKATRGEKIRDIQEVAQGRLFDGPAAVKAGLVDQTGTLNQTILAAAKSAGIQDDYQVLVYPEPKTLEDLLRGGLSSTDAQTRLPAELKALLQAMPLPYRREAMRLLSLCQSLQHERVLLALPAGIVEGD